MKTKRVNKPEIFIVSNTFDYSTDLVCLELQRRNSKYFRFNRDQIQQIDINLSLFPLNLLFSINQTTFEISEDNIKSIYYRAPTYLRDIYQPDLSLSDQLSRSQVTSFVRQLEIFENVKWMNKPSCTFRAENKFLQLRVAKNLGFKIPETQITNSKAFDFPPFERLIVKSVDTAIFRMEDHEAYTYTTFLSRGAIGDSNLSEAPVIVQEALSPKIDIRVTVIENSIFAVKILKNGSGIDGDWRKEKYGIEYVPITLTKELSDKCLNLLSQFNLSFGAIDLAIYKGEFFFLEINPTGEWGWLVNHAGSEMPSNIAESLDWDN